MPSLGPTDPKLAVLRARRRELEDRLLRDLAINGWSIGLAAVELDLDMSQTARHSKRLGIVWTRYPGRSNRGSPVSGVDELLRLRAKVRKGLHSLF